MKDKIEALISQMTLKEKLGQLTQEFLTNDRIEEVKDSAEKGEIGSFLLAADALAGDSKQESLFVSELNEIQRRAVEKSRLGIPVIYGRDIIHGSKTIFPIPLAQAATWDYDIIREGASIMCEEASYDGVHWTFAPMLDICTDPRWGRIIECPGEDPFLGKMFARASIEGIQGDDMSKKGKLAACAKHFIGYGASQGGRDKDPTEWSEYTLRNRALPPFVESVRMGVATFMSAFNEISGQPATSSRYYLTDVLRGELGFDGFVVSDCNAVERLCCQGVSDNDEDSSALAINAGVDMDMADCLYRNNLKAAYENGKVSMETIDEAVRRILYIKFKVGLFENPYTDITDTNDKVLTKEYLSKAKKASLHSMVLLKNEGILPLSKGTRVSVFGPYAGDRVNLLGSWFAGGDEKDVIPFADSVTSVNGKEYTDICADYTDSDADICLIALGEDRLMTGEGKNMPNIEMPEAQLELVKKAKEAGKKVVAVIFAGRPLALTFMEPYCDAILWAWHGGTMCAAAAADILFGDFNPCGRLPVTFPRTTGQIPIHYNHNRNEYVISGYYKHEKYVSSNMPSTPLYEFGYGLSYTDFSCSDFKCEKKDDLFSISFNIKNTGGFDGFETAQLYIQDKVASMARPVKELKAFKKVFIKKGEEKIITLSVNKDDLSFYDMRGSFVFEKGEFKFEIGSSSKNIYFETEEYIDF